MSDWRDYPALGFGATLDVPLGGAEVADAAGGGIVRMDHHHGRPHGL